MSQMPVKQATGPVGDGGDEEIGHGEDAVEGLVTGGEVREANVPSNAHGWREE